MTRHGVMVILTKSSSAPTCEPDVTELAHLLAPLNRSLFTFGNDHVSSAELAGFLTGVACVWLTVKARISNFPVGLANDGFFLVLFLAARLYADSGLQVVYLILGFAGWWQWLHVGSRRRARPMGRSGPAELVVLAGLVALSTWVLSGVLTRAHDIAPFWDALTTALSLAAQWLLNTKKIETWLWWMAADVIYIPLYFVKHLWLTGIVYGLFLTMCVLGLAAWRSSYKAGSPGPVLAVELAA